MISEATKQLFRRERREAEGLKPAELGAERERVRRDMDNCYGAAQMKSPADRAEDFEQRKSYRSEVEREIRDLFAYHKPAPAQAAAYEVLRDDFTALAIRLTKMIPPGAFLDAALTELQVAQMTANRAIALEK